MQNYVSLDKKCVFPQKNRHGKENCYEMDKKEKRNEKEQMELEIVQQQNLCACHKFSVICK